MTVYLVTYDLNKETKRPPLLAYLRHTYDWAKLSESSYAISTNHSADTVAAGFGQFLDNNDQLYVIRLTQPLAGWGPKVVNDWLNQRLPAASSLAA
jgi:hypothetical protein